MTQNSSDDTPSRRPRDLLLLGRHRNDDDENGNIWEYTLNMGVGVQRWQKIHSHALYP